MRARELRPGDGALHRIFPCKTAFALVGCRRTYITLVPIASDFNFYQNDILREG